MDYLLRKQVLLFCLLGFGFISTVGIGIINEFPAIGAAKLHNDLTLKAI
jgi:hypothetical protein